MYKKEFNIDNFNFNIDDILKAAWMAGKRDYGNLSKRFFS